MWGWEATETTVYEYTDGVLTSSTTTREREFDPEQVDLLLAIHEFDREMDPNGIPFWEATSSDADPTNYESQNPVRFIPKGPFTNWAEKSRLDAEETFRKQDGVNMNGLFWTVEKKKFSPIAE